MSAMAAAAIGTAVVGGVMSSNSSSRASAAQQQASREANALNKYMYDQTRADNAGYTQAGNTALSQMQDPNAQFNKSFDFSTYQQDPSYQYQQDEAKKALERSAAAGGGLMSGGTLKALNTQSTNLANQNYQSAFNNFQTDSNRRYGQLQNLASLGQNAIAGTSSAGSNYANAASNNITGAGNSQAASIIAANNASTGMMGQGLNAWAKYQMSQNSAEG